MNDWGLSNRAKPHWVSMTTWDGSQHVLSFHAETTQEAYDMVLDHYSLEFLMGVVSVAGDYGPLVQALRLKVDELKVHRDCGLRA